jgi:hypothetical protein
MKYKSEGIGKNKKIQEQRKKPLPIGLMKSIKETDCVNDTLKYYHKKTLELMNEKFKGLRIIRRRDIEDKINSQDVQCTENVD